LTIFGESKISPENIQYPHPAVHSLARVILWGVYSFWAGLVGTGIWILAHECGHGAFSESKTFNDIVGWVLHSAVGVPYHSWRISHSKHHASTSHMTLDQAFVPKTRSERKLPPLDPSREDAEGENVSDEVMKEMWEAVGDSPLMMALWTIELLLGWPAYLLFNATGQGNYPKYTNHFNPWAEIFGPHQRNQVILSDIGILLWLGTLIYWSITCGFGEMARVYLFPYLWVNHWIVLITFLQHTDPLLPHYRAAAFNFQRGALSTMDRSLLGGAGSLFGWLGGTLTHGISETHVLHHVCSKIPHYHAWEATDALRKRLEAAGYSLQGPPGGWTEVMRVLGECRFVENEGDVVFYKNSYGKATCKAVYPEKGHSDSGVDVLRDEE